MPKHDRLDLSRENRLVAANTRGALMSDTKWRNVFSALDASGSDVVQCAIKFVGIDEEKIIRRPGSAALRLSRPWIDTVEFGPVALRSIEWVLFPRVANIASTDPTIPGKQYVQDIDAAAETITNLGHYPSELTTRGLLITGYLV